MFYRREKFITAQDLRPGETVSVYGCGGRGRHLCREIAEFAPNVSVCCFFDSYSDSFVDGLSVYRFDSAPPKLKTKTHIVIASYHWQEIAEALEKQGHDNYSIADPNAESGTIHHGHLDGIIRSVKNLSEFGKIYEDIRRLPADATKAVIHNDSDHSPLGLENTVWEGHLDHRDERALKLAMADLPEHQITVLACHSDLGHSFYGSLAGAKSTGSRLALIQTRPRKIKIFLMEDMGAIYIPISKCASTSIMARLQKAYESAGMAHGYSSPKTKFKYVDPETFPFDRFYCFSFVRDPLKRLFSLYRDKKNDPDWLIRRMGEGRQPSFEEFVDFVCACPDGLAEIHFLSQHMFITGNEGKLIPDYIGKIEDFKRHCQDLAKRLPVLDEIGHLNKSKGKFNINTANKNRLESKLRKRYNRDYRLFYPV